jgi:hypothetical protein
MSNPRRTRKGAAEFLTSQGYPVTEATLATKATRGGGPPFVKFGVKPLYDDDECLDWARSRLSKSVTNTSELEAERAA